MSLVCALPLAACDKTDDQRCAELDRVIAAKATELPVRCEDDLDCLIVDIHAGLSVATTALVNDPELEATKSRRVELCGDFEDDLIVWEATCQENLGFETSSPGSQFECVAVEAGTIPRPDVGEDAPDLGSDTPDPDTPSPSCRSHDDCEPGSLCVEEFCLPLCADGCAHASECGALEDLGLGSSVANCIERCDRVARATGENGIALARCLRDTVCDSLADCF
jgi:hypothetical protein